MRNPVIIRPLRAPLLLLALALAWAAAGGHAALAAGDDWAALLGTAEPEAGLAAPVLGMTIEELDAYREEEQEAAAADDEEPEVFIRSRRTLVVREMKFNSDWDADPTAVPALVDQLRRRTGMRALALLPRAPLTFDQPELLDFPFVYMTAHYAFTLSPAETAGLRTYIERGGFILADDCLYGQTFGPAFQGEMARVFPEVAFEAVDVKAPVYGLVYRRKHDFPNAHETGIASAFRNANPFLGLVWQGYLRVVYMPQDMGCSWEISSPPTPANPLGAGMHGSDMYPGVRDAAYWHGINIMLFALTH
jgi:hypothetical protein